jgi:hypothetical protein
MVPEVYVANKRESHYVHALRTASPKSFTVGSGSLVRQVSSARSRLLVSFQDATKVVPAMVQNLSKLESFIWPEEMP